MSGRSAWWRSVHSGHMPAEDDAPIELGGVEGHLSTLAAEQTAWRTRTARGQLPLVRWQSGQIANNCNRCDWIR